MASDRTTLRGDRSPTRARKARTPKDPDTGRGGSSRADAVPVPDQLDQLRFIHDVARLATTART
jgi:hypothetical protein